MLKNIKKKEKVMKNAKKDFTFEEFNGIISTLRGEGGCPWDREQTHDSIKLNLLEEAYEAIEALESGNKMKFADELGDVLLQVVFHSQIGKEDGTFTIQDVINLVSEKMISRHTHIFGNDTAETSSEVLDTWEKNKIKEKGLSSYTDSLNDVCKYLPGLTYAQKVQKKASKAGMDWDKPESVLDKVAEETEEIKTAMFQKDETAIEEEIGDLLFSVVNLSRKLNVDAEQALRKSVKKFITRFALVEDETKKQNKDMKEMSLSELDEIWDKVKKY